MRTRPGARNRFAASLTVGQGLQKWNVFWKDIGARRTMPGRPDAGRAAPRPPMGMAGFTGSRRAAASGCARSRSRPAGRSPAR
jgi:hypothetical protein